jgi:hypothetical protein
LSSKNVMTSIGEELSTPCNGFLELVNALVSKFEKLSTPCNGFILLFPGGRGVVNFQLHVMDSTFWAELRKLADERGMSTFNSM